MMVCFIYNFNFSVKVCCCPLYILCIQNNQRQKKIGIFLRIMNKNSANLKTFFSYYPEQKNKKLNCGPKNLLQKTKNK